MFEDYTGRVHRTRVPSQGCNFAVTVIEAERGTFIRKTGDADWKIRALAEEARVLGLLAPYQPQVPGFVAREGDHFLFTYLPGKDLADCVAEDTDPTLRTRFSYEHGRFLRVIHSWSPNLPRPADWLAESLGRCRTNVKTGAVDWPADEFNTHAGTSPTDLLAYLEAHRADFTTELVFGHGDWCLPNALTQGETVTGAVDWSNGGYADYRYDLATGLWTLRRNLSPDPQLPRYLSAFLEGYGYPDSAESLAFFEAIYALL
jgi:aminoglycoside phosphotransferase